MTGKPEESGSLSVDLEMGDGVAQTEAVRVEGCCSRSLGDIATDHPGDLSPSDPVIDLRDGGSLGSTAVGRPVAVITTLYRSDRIDQFEVALASVEGQLGLAGEIRVYLCVDGPVSGEHAQWLAANRHRFYRILENRESCGLAASLNTLIEQLEDEVYVFRMDGDDISYPTRFASQIAHLDENPSLGLIGCHADDIDENGNVLALRRFPVTHDDCLTALRALNPILHPTFCLRREVLRDKRLRYPVAHLNEDLAFVVTLVEHGIRIGNADATLFGWRQGPSFFERRRSLARGLVEFRWYAKAIRSRRGLLTLDYLYPGARVVLRLLPPSVQRGIYRTGLRSRMVAAHAGATP